MFAGFFASIWTKIGVGVLIAAIAGGLWWRVEFIIGQNKALKIENAQLEQTIRDKEKEIALANELNAEREKSLEEVRKQQQASDDALRNIESELAKRTDGGKSTSEYIKAVMRKIRDAERGN